MGISKTEVTINNKLLDGTQIFPSSVKLMKIHHFHALEKIFRLRLGHEIFDNIINSPSNSK